MKQRVVIASVLLLIAVSTVSAQDAEDRTRRVEKVILIPLTGEDIVGELLELGPTALKLRVDNVVREIPLDSVVRIDRRGDSVKNGAIIGGAIGLAVGLSFIAEYGGEAVGFALATSGIWALLGTGVDALIPGRTAIYRRPPSQAAAAAGGLALSWSVLF